jgi:hypothetical protein
MTEDAKQVEIHLDPAIADGEADTSSWVDHPGDWRGQHEIWEHANQTISKPFSSRQDLETAVIQLQRSVEHRDKLLDKPYSFEAIPGRKPGTKYETMADLKIIRPTLKIRPRELRNKLTHEVGEIQITASDCEELLDTSWYYLKATDHIAQQCISEISWSRQTGRETISHLDASFTPGKWNIWVNVWCPRESLLNLKTLSCLTVCTDLSRIHVSGEELRVSGNAIGLTECPKPSGPCFL